MFYANGQPEHLPFRTDAFQLSRLPFGNKHVTLRLKLYYWNPRALCYSRFGRILRSTDEEKLNCLAIAKKKVV
jgi:hypothetical protein